MNLLVTVFFIIGLSVTSVAQDVISQQVSPNLEIVSWKWEIYYNPLNQGYSSSITVEDNIARERKAKRTDSSQGTVPVATAPDPFMRSSKTIGKARYGYIYTVVIKNQSNKNITAINWDYVFVNPDNLSVISRHNFRNIIKLKPKKQKKMKSLTVVDPTRIIDINIIDRKLIEKVIINSIEYSDGSVWQLN